MVWSVPNAKRVDPLTMIKVLLLVAWLSIGCQGSPLLGRALVKRGDGIRVCGRMLVDALNLMCEGEYYDPSEDSTRRMGKRAAPLQSMDPYNDWISLSLNQRASNPDEIGIQQRSSGGQQKPQQLQRYQRGVVDECCRKSCSASTLLTYCRLT